MRYRLSNHAQEEMRRRGISSALLDSLLYSPQQIVSGQGTRKIYQSQMDFGGGRIFLVRAVVADDADPAVVVTVYRTSKIAKYWI